MKEKWSVIIVRRSDEETVETIPCHDYRNAEVVQRGVNHNLNHDEYYASIDRDWEDEE